MDLTDLDLVVAVAEAGSITHGAETVYLSLPSASARLRALERAVGAQLFDRNRRGVTPTPAGELLLRHARAVRHRLEQMHDDLAEYAHGQSGTVQVLANTSAGLGLLPDVLVDFLRVHPTACVDVQQRTSKRIVSAVAERRADLGVVADSADLGNLETRRLRADPLVVVAPTGHPLACGRSTSYTAALAYSFVGLGAGGALEEHIEEHAAPLGVRPRHRVRMPTVPATLTAVAAGIGIAVLPRAVVSTHDLDRLALVDLDEPWARRHLVLCSHPSHPLSPTARALHEQIRRDTPTDGATGPDAPGVSPGKDRR